MRLLFTSIVAIAMTAGAAWAQDQTQATESHPFEGGTLTITAMPDLTKVLAFDGRELARDYDVSYDRTEEIGGLKVAIFAVGGGGNMCPPSTVLVWKPEGSALKADTMGGDCGGPLPAATSEGIYFVPFLLPGASADVREWTPARGLQVIGRMEYTPVPGTGWGDLDLARLDNITDALRNEAVYAAAKKLLVAKFTDVVTGLLVGGGTQSTPSGVFYASGCVPHDCGGADGFMAVDPGAHKVYFAQQGDDGRLSAWPSVKNWPKDLRDAMKQALSGG